MRAFRVLRPLRLVSGVPSKFWHFLTYTMYVYYSIFTINIKNQWGDWGRNRYIFMLKFVFYFCKCLLRKLKFTFQLRLEYNLIFAKENIFWIPYDSFIQRYHFWDYGLFSAMHSAYIYSELKPKKLCNFHGKFLKIPSIEAITKLVLLFSGRFLGSLCKYNGNIRSYLCHGFSNKYHHLSVFYYLP